LVGVWASVCYVNRADGLDLWAGVGRVRLEARAVETHVETWGVVQKRSVEWGKHQERMRLGVSLLTWG